MRSALLRFVVSAKTHLDLINTINAAIVNTLKLPDAAKWGKIVREPGLKTN